MPLRQPRVDGMTTPSATVRLDDLIGAIAAEHDPRWTGCPEPSCWPTTSARWPIPDRPLRRPGPAGGCLVVRDRPEHGVTEQAAQKRFVAKAGAPDPSQGFSRFTDRARASSSERRRRPGRPATTHRRRPPGAGSGGRPREHGGQRDRGPGRVPRRRPAHGDGDAARPGGEVPEMVPFDAHARRALELTFREALRLARTRSGAGTSCSPCWR